MKINATLRVFSLKRKRKKRTTLLNELKVTTIIKY